MRSLLAVWLLSCSLIAAAGIVVPAAARDVVVGPLSSSTAGGPFPKGWRVRNLIDAADLYDKQGDDLPARLYVMFDYPSDKLSLVERGKILLARSLAGDIVPAAAICYVWDGKLPVGTSLTNVVVEAVGSEVQHFKPGGAGFLCWFHRAIDHRQPLAPQVEALGLGAPGFGFSTTQTEQHLADIVELIAPQGRYGLIDDPKEPTAMPFKRKAVSFH